LIITKNEIMSASAAAAPPRSSSAVSNLTSSNSSLNNNSNHLQGGRPPKPAGIPFGGHTSTGLSGSDADLNNSNNTGSMRDVSERSRASLKERVQSRRASLTQAEAGFLLELVERGEEIEVELAYENLLDDELFFDPSNTTMLMQDDSETGWRSDQFQLGRERDFSTRSLGGDDLGSPGVEITNMQNLMKDESINTLASYASAGSNMGSERRQMLLQQRRNSLTHGKMWKAHETGLAVSQTASRRSVMERRNSLNSNNKLWLRQQEQAIFRRGDTTKSDNHSRSSKNSSPRRPLGRPFLRRMQSDSSRKSVTFSTLPLREGAVESFPPNQQQQQPRLRISSVGGIPPPQRAAPRYERSNSIGSYPSLHHGHPISSAYERRDSMGSIPSIHHGHPVSSPRTTSGSSGVPSLHRAHSVHSVYSSTAIRDDSAASDITESEAAVAVLLDDDVYFVDEKKTADPVPSKVVIPGEKSNANSRLQHDDDLQDATKLLHKNDSDAPHELLMEALSKSASSEHQRHPGKVGRPVIMREASSGNYRGEGVEVADWFTERQTSFDVLEAAPSVGDSLVSFGGGGSVQTSNSFDERMSHSRVGHIFRRAMNRRRSMSEDSLGAGIILGGTRYQTKETGSMKDLVPTDDDSWKLDDDDEDYYDSWKVIEDEYVNGYGGGGTLPFRILGTSADDIDAHPHVLSPPLMESLQAFLPSSESGSNFWMKYSLVRDGASSQTFLQHARGAKYSILAIETLDGEVFGAFTAEPWRKNWNYFGSGESFLWKMRKSRRQKCHSIIDQAQMESEIDVFPFTGANHCIQLCTHDKIAVGGGSVESSPASSPGKASKRPNKDSDSTPKKSTLSSDFKDHEWGFGITVEGDFLHGTVSCMPIIVGCQWFFFVYRAASTAHTFNIFWQSYRRLRALPLPAPRCRWIIPTAKSLK